MHSGRLTSRLAEMKLEQPGQSQRTVLSWFHRGIKLLRKRESRKLKRARTSYEIGIVRYQIEREVFKWIAHDSDGWHTIANADETGVESFPAQARRLAFRSLWFSGSEIVLEKRYKL
jgi:hypothetical protein